MLEITVFWWEPWSTSWKTYEKHRRFISNWIMSPKVSGWTFRIMNKRRWNRFNLKQIWHQKPGSPVSSFFIRWFTSFTILLVGVKNHYPKGVSPVLKWCQRLPGKISSAFSTPLPPRIFNFPIHLSFFRVPVQWHITLRLLFVSKTEQQRKWRGTQPYKKHISYFPVCPMSNHEIPFSLLKCHFTSNL